MTDDKVVIQMSDISDLKECLRLEFKMFMESTGESQWDKARRACAEKSQLAFTKVLRDMYDEYVLRIIGCLGVDKNIIWLNLGKMNGCTISKPNKKPQDAYWCLIIGLKKHIGYTAMDITFEEIPKSELRDMNRVAYFERQVDLTLGYEKKPLDLRPYKPTTRGQKIPPDIISIEKHLKPVK